MRDAMRPVSSRRELLQNTGRLAAASALAGVAIPSVHAAGTTRSRWPWSAAAAAAPARPPTRCRPRAARSSSSPWPTSSRTSSTSSYDELTARTLGDKVDVPDDRKFIGFDAYKKAMDCLKPGDVVILATPPAFRWVHFTYAIEKGLNVFMEKPVTVDGPTTQQDARAGRGGDEEEPQGRRRPDVPPLRGAAGAVQADQGRRRSATSSCCAAYRQTGPVGYCALAAQARRHQRADVPDPAVPRLPLGQRRLLQRLPDPQHRRVLLDEGRLAGQGPGHRRPRTTASDYIDQNFDTYSVEYTFADGTKLFLEGRNIDGCNQEFASYAHGTKGSAVISNVGTLAGQVPASTRARSLTRTNLVWAFPPARAEPLPARVGRPDRRDPQGQAVQRGEAGRRGQPGHLDGPHGRPHRPGHHLRRHAQLRARVRPGRRQADRWTRRRP